MRDLRYGARSQVVLDRGQLIGLAFFAVLSGGLMFALGYAAGKSRRVVAELPGETTLGRVDQNYERQRQREQVDLTFYQSVLEKATRPKVQELMPEAKPEPRRIEAQAVVVKAAAKEEAEAAPEEVEVKPAPVAVHAPRVPEPHPAPVQTDVAAIEAPAPSGGYTIQVSAFHGEDEAQGYAKHLQAKGFAASVVPVALAGKGTWYRVRVGRFESDAAARLYKQRLDREGFPAWIVRAD